jgi:energy-coupling factor transporter transmembrane protein EcfT
MELFEKGNNSIAFFPYIVLKRYSYYILAFVVLMNLPFIKHIMNKPYALLPTLFLILIIVIPFLYFGFKAIIIDGNEKKVIEKTFFGKTNLAELSEIEKIVMVNDESVAGPNSAYFKLVLKTDVYGKGIRLSLGHKMKSDEFQSLDKEAMPYLKVILKKKNV